MFPSDPCGNEDGSDDGGGGGNGDGSDDDNKGVAAGAGATSLLRAHLVAEFRITGVGRRIHAYRQPCCDVRRGGAEGAGPGGLPPLPHRHRGVRQSRKPGQLLELVGWMWMFMRLDWTGLDRIGRWGLPIRIGLNVNIILTGC